MVRLTGYDCDGNVIVSIYCDSYEAAENEGNDYCECGRWFDFEIEEDIRL